MLRGAIIGAALLLSPATVAGSPARFDAAVTQRQFLDAVDGGDGGMAVASLASSGLFAAASSGAEAGAEGDVRVTAVRDANVVLLDCADFVESSRDVRIAVGVASAVVCDVLYPDLLRGSAQLTALQYAMECTLAATGGAAPASKKQLYVACVDCGVDAAAVKGALSDLVTSAWSAAAKPNGSEGADVSEFFDLHFETLPHRKRAASEFASKSLALLQTARAAGQPRSATELSNELESIAASCSGTRVAVGAKPSHGDALANAVCNVHMETALEGFMDGLPELSAELGEAFDDFGETCDAAVDRAVATFNGLAVVFDGTALQRTKTKELQARVIEQLEPIYRGQVKQLEELAWDRMRKRLVKLRVNDPSLMKDMEASVQDADTFFRDTVKRMACKGSSWSADQTRREMVADMRLFVGEKLQGARLQGAYVPGMQRRPIAVSLHYLATKPFQLLDSLQDSLSYEEDMDWEPDFASEDSQDGVVRSAKAIPAGVSAMTGKWVRKAEQR